MILFEHFPGFAFSAELEPCSGELEKASAVLRVALNDLFELFLFEEDRFSRFVDGQVDGFNPFGVDFPAEVVVRDGLMRDSLIKGDVADLSQEFCAFRVFANEEVVEAHEHFK